MKKDYDIDMLKLIGDFLELGHVENIVAMFKKDSSLYDLAGGLLRDERFAVRLGTAVLFEELAATRPEEVSLAIPSLAPLLKKDNPIFRGEAATILGIISSGDAISLVSGLKDDPDPQVREIAADILQQGKDTPAPRPDVSDEQSR